MEPSIHQLMERGGGMILTSEAERAGVSRMMLSKLVQTGVLERTGRGVYVKAGAMEDELYALQQRASKLVYSHETALFLHGMTDRTPFQHSVTVPSGYKPSPSMREQCKIYYIKSDLLGTGVQELPSGMGHAIMAYDLERTLCDVLRSRNRMDHQIVVDALKCYAARKDKNLNRLATYANQFGVQKMLHSYLEVLL